jgi:hypothetical protein
MIDERLENMGLGYHGHDHRAFVSEDPIGESNLDDLASKGKQMRGAGSKRGRINSSPQLPVSLPLPKTARATRVNLQDLPLGGIEERNSRRLAPAHKHLRIGIVSNLAPLWLPAASRLGQVQWIAGSTCAGFQVEKSTTIHPLITPDLLA